MAIPKNKQELVAAIETSYLKLKDDLESIPQHLVRDKALQGHAKGTKMSVSNLVAYLIGWGTLVLKWNAKKERGEAVDFPETGYKWNELGQLAQKFYSDYDTLSYNELLDQLQEVVTQLLDLVRQADVTTLYTQPWYNQWTKGRMIQLNTAAPYKNARSRVRKWKRETIQ